MAIRYLCWRALLAKLINTFARAGQGTSSPHPPTSPVSNWTLRLTALDAAQQTYDQHVRTVYQPTLQVFEAELSELLVSTTTLATQRLVRRILTAKHRIAAIEGQGDELIAQREAAALAMLSEAAPNLRALKLAWIRDHMIVDEPLIGVFSQVLADAETLNTLAN